MLLASCGNAGRMASAEGNANAGQEAVNIGYGSTQKDNLTYSVSGVDFEQKEISGYSNIWDYLRGRVPGVSIGNASAGSTPEIIIRGIGTNSSSTQPLIMVDGMEVSDINYLNPNDVANVSVLKDGSTAIYGARGANGVILITTKTAQEAAEAEAAAHKAEKQAKKEAKKAKKADK